MHFAGRRLKVSIQEDQALIDSLEKANVVQTSVNYIDSQWMDVGKDLEAMYTGASTPEDVLKTIMGRAVQNRLNYRKTQAGQSKDRRQTVKGEVSEAEVLLGTFFSSKVQRLYRDSGGCI